MVPQVVFQRDGVLAVNWVVVFSATVAEAGETVTARQGRLAPAAKAMNRIRSRTT